MPYEFEGKAYEKPRNMLLARSERYVEHPREDMSFTRAAHAVGVSKRTGKVWRNGRTRSTGRSEQASVDWYSGSMNEPEEVDGYYPSQEERIAIADLLHARCWAHGRQIVHETPSETACTRCVHGYRGDGVGRAYRKI